MNRLAFASSVLASAAFLLAPQAVLALTLTLTFDDGIYDPTIVEDNIPETHGPYDWIESNGIRAAGFWATDVGTVGATFQQGHTHIRDDNLRPGNSFKMHAWTNDLQGIEISLDSGLSFDIVSIDYRIGTLEDAHPDFQRLDWIWGIDEPQMLLSTDFDPTAADIEGEWTALSLGDGSGFQDWNSTPIAGFTGITRFFLAHSLGSLYVDSIVLEVYVPEASTLSMLAMVGLALVGRAAPSRRRRRVSLHSAQSSRPA